MAEILRMQRIAVRAEGQLIALTIGDRTIRMEYATAMHISAMLEARCNEAKLNSEAEAKRWIRY